MQHWIEADWPAHHKIRAITSLRSGGVSSAAYASLNLGTHVGDDPANVATNRHRLKTWLSLPDEPLWLNQIHGTEAVCAEQDPNRTADACYTRQAGTVCAVMTADCLPILLCDRAGITVAAIHAGWRGLQAGIIARTIRSMASEGLMAWLGPAIGPRAFEVGKDVYDAFGQGQPALSDAFIATNQGKWLADIYHLARHALRENGVTAIYGGDYCTYSDPVRFFSYRRDQTTGRMASLIWIQPSP